MHRPKLLAARKKLREFQRSKLKQAQAAKLELAPEFDENTLSSAENNINLQQNVEQNNIENSLPFSRNDNSSPESNQPNSVIDNTNLVESQSSCDHNSYVQINHNKSEDHAEKIKHDTEVSDLSTYFSTQDDQFQITFESIKDSFTSQKNLLLELSTDVQNTIEDKCPVDNDKIVVDQLQKELLQYKNLLLQAEKMSTIKEIEFRERLDKEVHFLQEQLQAQKETTIILVATKAELSTALNQSQEKVQQKTDEVKDLSEKLKISHYKITELENDIKMIKINKDDVQKNFHEMQNRYDHLNNQFVELRKTKEDLELENSELKQKLKFKNIDHANLQQELQEKIALLSLSNLKIQQLTNSSHDTKLNDSQDHSVGMYEQQIIQLKETIKSLTDEKSDAGKQYKNYVQQLDDRYSQITNELETAKKHILEYQSREESYIQRLSEMEQQLQQGNKKIESLATVDDHESQISILTENINKLTFEQESLQTALANKDAEIENLKYQLEELLESKEQIVDTTKLLSALESEQQGASMAVSQNQQLKIDLDEMHKAFITLSNDKLSLTEQLQAEKNIGKKMNSMLNETEEQLEKVKQQLMEKETALSELEKEKFRSSAIEDQVNHYQVQAHHATLLQEEMSKATKIIEALQKDNYVLNEKINQLSSKNNLEVVSADSEEQTEVIDIAETKDAVTVDTDIEERTQKISSETQTSQIENDICFNIPEPLKKLEIKFKKTMEQVADLTDEKQRLEHLVMQLQGETETIGEYIALYQKQRMLLHHRVGKKEQSFKSLINQRNQLQEQLHKLKVLVSQLIQNKIKNLTLNDIKEVNPENKVDVNEKTTNIIDSPSGMKDDNITSEIMDLLTEIKDCNVNCNSEPDFHPCPWCSGKLITV